MNVRGIFLASAIAASTTALVATAEADSTNVVYTPQDAFDEVATIMEGRVASISYSYDPQQGPRTIANFVNVTTHAGTHVTGSLQLATLGGPLPDGRFLDIPELPDFEVGRTYVVFLTAADWFYSPVVADYAFRVEQTKGTERMVNQTGNPVVGVTPQAIRLYGRSVDLPGVDALHGRIMAPDGATVLAQGATKAAFVADIVRLHTERVSSLSATGDPTHSAPKAFKETPRTDRAWNVTPASPHESGSAGNSAPMCIEVDEPAVCQ